MYPLAAGPHLESCAHEARLVLNKSDAPRFSLTSWGQVKELFEGLYLILFRPKELITMVGSILKTCFGYLLVAAAFLFFMGKPNNVVFFQSPGSVVVDFLNFSKCFYGHLEANHS